MLDRRPASASTSRASEPDLRPLIVVGITHAQTCLVLPARIRAFTAAGFRVELISSPGPLLDRMVREQGIDAVPIPMKRGIALFSDLVSFFRVCRALRRLRPTVTEFSTPKAALLGNLAAMMCRVPIRVYLLRGLRLETLTGLRRRLMLASERIACACAHHVVCNSKSLRRKVIRLRVVSARKVHLMGQGSSQGVDIHHFAPGRDNIRLRLGIPQDVPVVGFVGRLTRDKGIPELIRAFDRILEIFPTARLLLVGWFDESDDALDAALRQKIERHPAIVFTGYMRDPAPWYRAMDVFVLPTWREGFPNVVLEASATGLPVVTTIATGSRDAVLPEITGLLIPAGYPEAIAEAVLRLLRDPHERARMGSAGRAWVIEHFVNARVLGITVGFYCKLLEEGAAAGSVVLATDAAAVGD